MVRQYGRALSAVERAVLSALLVGDAPGVEQLRRRAAAARVTGTWTEVNAAEPELRVHIHVDLTDVADGGLLEGVMHVGGRLQEDIEPFETRLRVEFYDEAD